MIDDPKGDGGYYMLLVRGCACVFVVHGGRKADTHNGFCTCACVCACVRVHGCACVRVARGGGGVEMHSGCAHVRVCVHGCACVLVVHLHIKLPYSFSVLLPADIPGLLLVHNQ